MTKASPKTRAPEVSVVIPVYNEEGILSASLSDLLEKLTDVDFAYEIIIAETVQAIEPSRLRKSSARSIRRSGHSVLVSPIMVKHSERGSFEHGVSLSCAMKSTFEM